jgi:hypothetical protein
VGPQVLLCEANVLPAALEALPAGRRVQREVQCIVLVQQLHINSISSSCSSGTLPGVRTSPFASGQHVGWSGQVHQQLSTLHPARASCALQLCPQGCQDWVVHHSVVSSGSLWTGTSDVAVHAAKNRGCRQG